MRAAVEGSTIQHLHTGAHSSVTRPGGINSKSTDIWTEKKVWHTWVVINGKLHDKTRPKA